MKIFGIILLLVGLLSFFGGLVNPSGAQTSVVVLGYLFKFAFIIVGIITISKANKKNSGENE